MAKDKDKDDILKSPGKKYNLYQEIKKEPKYKSNIGVRDKFARKIIEEQCPTAKGSSQILPGQLLSFDYFEPKTKEELEYYDAMPVTIFFNRINTPNGLRVLGFNIHYYPPRIRFQIMNRIFEIWRPMYSKEKTWLGGLEKSMNHFDYNWLMEQLTKNGLAFGVRMYDPSLISNMKIVPPSMWSKAVFSEGRFKKRTRQAILEYWLQYAAKKDKSPNARRILARRAKKVSGR